MLQTIALRSKQPYGERLPPVPVGNLLTRIPKLVRQSVAMAFERRSKPRGRPPQWLVDASDVRVMGLRGEHETTVCFDVPRLGDAAAVIYAQGELFPTRPDPDETGFDLLADVLDDIRRGEEDSRRFDRELLRSIAGLDKVVNGRFSEMIIAGARHRSGDVVVADHVTIATARVMHSKTPPPVRARVVGVLDQFRISTHAFSMVLESGEEVRGVVSEDDLEAALDLFRQRAQVVVRGSAFFRPSGQLLLVDADDLDPAGQESSIWSRSPKPAERAVDPGALRVTQGRRSGLAAVLGRWPGDESDEEVEAALREIS